MSLGLDELDKITKFLFINWLTPGKFEWNFRHIIFKQILVIDGGGISCEIALIWMSLDFTDDQSTLVQVMAWCRQATSHYLSQSWPRSLSPYGVTRPQWVKMHLITSLVKYRPLRSGRNMLIHSLVPMCWLMLFWPSSNQSMNVISVDPGGRHPNNTITCNEPSAGLW